MVHSSVVKKRTDVEKKYDYIHTASDCFIKFNNHEDMTFLGDSITGSLHSNEHIIQNPAFTYFIKVGSKLYFENIISPGNILVVDRSIIPKIDQLVIAMVDNTPSLMRVQKHSINSYLVDRENNKILMFDQKDVSIWGVITFIIHKLPQCD